MLTEPIDAVIGIDTHKHTHTAAAVTETGAVLEHMTVPADPKGYRHLLAFGRRQVLQPVRQLTNPFDPGQKPPMFGAKLPAYVGHFHIIF